YACLYLPSAKTAWEGEVQQVYLVQQGEHVGAIEALHNLATATPALPIDPLFSWRDHSGNIRPLTCSSALKRIGAILHSRDRNSSFGHSSRIGGAAYFLTQSANPEIVHIQGRWKALTYQLYICAFEQVA
ncbi:hypothetical protein FOMPIDRAFT_63262, partial [Fomitopsis schrenkii]